MNQFLVELVGKLMNGDPKQIQNLMIYTFMLLAMVMVTVVVVGPVFMRNRGGGK